MSKPVYRMACISMILLLNHVSAISQITRDIALFNARLDKTNKVNEICRLKSEWTGNYRKCLILELQPSDPKCFQNSTSVYNCIWLDTIHYQIALLEPDEKLYGSIAYNQAQDSYDLILNSDGGRVRFVSSPDAPKDDPTSQYIANRAVAIRNILRLKPDAIMAYSQLANTFLFLKYDRIFVYRIDTFDSFELDSYVRLILKANTNPVK